MFKSISPHSGEAQFHLFMSITKSHFGCESLHNENSDYIQGTGTNVVKVIPCW